MAAAVCQQKLSEVASSSLAFFGSNLFVYSKEHLLFRLSCAVFHPQNIEFMPFILSLCMTGTWVIWFSAYSRKPWCAESFFEPYVLYLCVRWSLEAWRVLFMASFDAIRHRPTASLVHYGNYRVAHTVARGCLRKSKGGRRKIALYRLWVTGVATTRGF